MIKTILLGYWVILKELLTFASNLIRYRKSPQYLKAEMYLLKHYCFRNPYRMCRRYIERLKEPSQPYGETPLCEIEKILDDQNITSNDLFVDLGCGRGKLLYWVSAQYPCLVKGVEINPTFVKLGNKIIQSLQASQRISIVEASFFTANISTATVIYLYAIALEDKQLTMLASLLSQHPPETRIISVSDPLNDYCDEPLFETIKTYEATFLWGKTTLFLQCPLGWTSS